jgi:hypothetical protein
VVARCVELRHQFAIRGTRGGKILVAFLQLAGQVDNLLFEFGDAALQRVDVGGNGESRLSSGLLAQHLRQRGFQLSDPRGLPCRALLSIG